MLIKVAAKGIAVVLFVFESFNELFIFVFRSFDILFMINQTNKSNRLLVILFFLI